MTNGRVDLAGIIHESLPIAVAVGRVVRCIVAANVLRNFRREVLQRSSIGLSPDLYVDFLSVWFADPALGHQQVGGLVVGHTLTVMVREGQAEFTGNLSAVLVHIAIRHDGAEPFPIRIRRAVQILVNVGLAE